MKELLERDFIVYDIEIARCIPDRRAPRDPALDYCEGWHDHANMGIAVLCAFDTRSQHPRVFLADNLDAFGQLIRDRCVVGFNNDSFDDRLLEVHGMAPVRSWDLLVAARQAVGEPSRFTPGLTRGGRKLDDFAAFNLGIQKSMHGELAPVEWQRGNRGAVIDYCLRDVMLTRALVDLAVDGKLMDPPSGAPLEIDWSDR